MNIPTLVALRFPAQVFPRVSLAGLLLLASACNQAPTSIEKQEPAVAVTTKEVALITTPVRLRLTGTLRGSKETELAANVAGRVMKTSVERGQAVQAGALLAQVDVRAAQLSLAEARVSVETTKTQQQISQVDCERYERLKQSGAVSDLEYDQVTAKCRTAPLQVEAAEARQRLLAKNVGDGVIRAPFSGTVTERFVEEGEYVQASSRVVSIAQVDELRLIFSVPEKNYPDVKLGAEVAIQVAAYKEQVFQGKVAHISGAVRSTRDVVVEATVANTEGKLLPGMFADIELTIGERPLPSVPKTAVFEQNGKLNAFVVESGILQQRVIAVEPSVGENFPVKLGIREKERVVLVHDPSLSNGQRVK